MDTRTTLHRCDACATLTAPADLEPGAALANVCSRCRLLEAAAFAVGAHDAKHGTYNCQPFFDHSTFTAYERGHASVTGA